MPVNISHFLEKDKNSSQHLMILSTVNNDNNNEKLINNFILVAQKFACMKRLGLHPLVSLIKL